jgi:tetratricopeptide (TPR) repeat protein
MNSKFLVQDFCSRSETLKYRLSNESWIKGIGTFFSENVPFSYSTSVYFAEKLVALLQEISKDANAVNVVELGAGLGLLSKQMLTVARQENSDLFSKLKFTVSDNSDSCIESIRKNNVFQNFQDHVHLQHENALDPISITQDTDLVVMSYLLDSLDCKHIEVIDGEIFEIVVQTHFDNTSPILDSTLWLPKQLSEEDVKSLLFGPPTKEKLVLLTPLSASLRETFKRVPLQESSLTHFEKEELKEFIEWLDCDEDILFNYSPMASSGLDSMLTRIGDRGLCYIFDFGSSQKVYKKPYEKLFSSYGVCTFFDVYFPFVKFKAERKGFHFCSSDFENGESQSCLLIKGYDVQKIESRFETLFKLCELNGVYKLLEDIKSFDNKDKFLNDVDIKTSGLNKSLKKSYFYLHSLALECFKRGFKDESEGYCREIIDFYGPMAVSAYSLLGLIELERKNHKSAINYFKLCIDAAPYISEFYLHLSIAHGHLKNYDEFKLFSRRYFYFASDYVVWNHYITYSLILIQNDQKKEAVELLLWLKRIFILYEEGLSDFLPVKVDSIIKEFHLETAGKSNYGVKI